MAKRTVSVVATATFEYEIDDEAVSDWDGATILDALKRRRDNQPPVYLGTATQDDILGSLGVSLCIDNRTMGSFDGWADFHESAASGSPYSVQWDFEHVEVSEPEVTGG